MSKNQRETDRTMALAGIFQAAALASNIALNKPIHEGMYHASLESIFKVDAPDVKSVYGDPLYLRTGLSTLKDFAAQKPYFKEKILLRYILYMIRAAKKILNNKEMSQQLSRRLQPIISQAHHLGPHHELVMRELSMLYRQVFLERRLFVMILGNTTTLKDPLIIQKIFSMLVAGIRSAVLWYQLGGSRLQLLFQRTHIGKSAHILLQHEYSR